MLSYPHYEENGIYYGCVSCRSGSEVSVARGLEEKHPGLTAHAVLMVKRRSNKGKKYYEDCVAIPGYVFFRTEGDFVLGEKPRDLYKLLRTSDEDWRLAGSDRDFAAWVFAQGGKIGLSKAWKEGDRIRIASGPLKDLEGAITRVDKHSGNGQVELEVDGRVFKVWLCFELVEGVEEASLRGDSEQQDNV